MKRRFFLFAAPAIVAAPSLMRVSTLVLPPRKETLAELMARKIREAEEAMRADLERVFDDFYTQPSGPPFGLATLIADDAPIIGGIDRASFEWWDVSGSVTYYGRV